ncbi:hypothetical protein I4U23_015738 [Adineta vaga]|nr:hypothetical protein I4U23_015738 [Adineta vaga]
MIFVPTNENTIYIPTINKGCLKREFDSKYPNRLNGIITANQFKESMNNINKIISSRVFKIIARLILFICVLGGILLIILSNTAFPKPNLYGFPIIVFAGLMIVIANNIVHENYRFNPIIPQSSTPPPPYNSLSLKKICSQCDASTQNDMDRFCTACGLPFHRY